MRFFLSSGTNGRTPPGFLRIIEYCVYHFFSSDTMLLAAACFVSPCCVAFFFINKKPGKDEWKGRVCMCYLCSASIMT